MPHPKHDNNLTGRVFGRLKVTREIGINRRGYMRLVVKCECNNTPEFVISQYALVTGGKKSCGCLTKETRAINGMNARKLLIPGTVFGKWVVQGMAGSGSAGLRWKVKCSCEHGTVSEVRGSSLRNGHSTNCGCVSFSNPAGWMAAKVLKSYKDGAAKRNLVWELPEKYFYTLTASNCYYCNAPPSNFIKYKLPPKSRKETKPDFYYSGIDRVDNLLGYIESNVAPCCSRCNKMKERLTKKEFTNHIAQVAEFHSIKNIQERVTEWIKASNEF